MASPWLGKACVPRISRKAECRRFLTAVAKIHLLRIFRIVSAPRNQNLWCVILQKNILSGLFTGRYQTFSLLFIGDWTIARGYADLYFVFSWQGPRQDCASNDSPIEDMLRIKNIALFQKVDQVIHSTKILLKSLAYSNLTCSLLPFFGISPREERFFRTLRQGQLGYPETAAIMLKKLSSGH